MTSPSYKPSLRNRLLLALILSFCFTISSSVLAETPSPQKLSSDEVLRLVQRNAQEELGTFIQQADEAELNMTFDLAYGQGKASLLSLVIQLGNKELVEQLLTKGAKPGAAENEEKIPLIVAIENQQLDIAKLLLESGANPSVLLSKYQGSDEKETLLYQSLQKSSLKPFVNTLITFKPELIYTEAMKDENQRDYLGLALQNGHSVNVVRYLLENGEDINKKPTAFQSSNYEIFLQQARFFYPNSKEELLASEERLAIFNLILDTVNDITPVTNRECYEPLFIVQSDMKTLNLLLEKGLDPNKGSCYRSTHLTIAAQLGYIPIFKALLDAGGVITEDTVTTMIDSEHSNDLVLWVWQHKAETFKQCKAESCVRYLNGFTTNNKTDGDFTPIVNELLKSLKGNTKQLNNALVSALGKNNIDFADRLLNEGANPLDEECNCQQRLWSLGTKPEAMDWLIKHKVNPFLGEKAFQDVVRVDLISEERLTTLLKMAPKDKLTKENLHSLLISAFKPLSNGGRLDYIKLQKYITLFATYDLALNNVIDESGKPFIQPLIRKLIEQETSHHGDIKLLWLLAQGAKVSEENQQHYLDNSYLRALVDRAGVTGEDTVLQPQNQEQVTGLNALIKERIDSDSVKIINVLITANLMPVNETIGLKTSTQLKDESITPLLYACHYASHNSVWEWLKDEIRASDQQFNKLYEVCTASNLPVDKIMQAPLAAKRKDWFKSKFPEVNFGVVELGEEASLETEGNTAPATLNKEELIKAQTLFAEQLKKVDENSIAATQANLTLLTNNGAQLPDKALETFVSGTRLDNFEKDTFNSFVKQLVAAGSDATAPMFNNGFSFMERLTFNSEGQSLYNDLYKTLSFSQKLSLWNAPLTRTFTSLREIRDADDDLRKPLGAMMIFLGGGLIATFIATSIALIVYFRKVKKQTIAKTIIPKWPLQCAFWAGAFLLFMAIFKSVDLDGPTLAWFLTVEQLAKSGSTYEVPSGFFQWSTWMFLWSLTVIGQIVSLIIIFKKTMLQKQYYAFTLFASSMFFFLTLSLPVWLIYVAEQHSMITFPLRSIF